MTIQQIKRNARFSLQKMWMRVLIGFEVTLWTFIVVAWVISYMR
jgi:hypothetical protein